MEIGFFELRKYFKSTIMKQSIISIVLVLLAALFMSSLIHRQSTIIGRINPVNGAKTVYAIRGNDSANSTPVNGAFNFNVKPGTYTVYVVAVPPYKDVSLENIDVKEGSTVDMGEIVLKQ